MAVSQRSSAPTTAPQSRWRKRTGPPSSASQRSAHCMSATIAGSRSSTLLGEPVPLAGALAGLAVGLALEQAGLDELAQAGGGHGLARAERVTKSSKRVVP